MKPFHLKHYLYQNSLESQKYVNIKNNNLDLNVKKHNRKKFNRGLMSKSPTYRTRSGKNGNVRIYSWK